NQVIKLVNCTNVWVILNLKLFGFFIVYPQKNEFYSVYYKFRDLFYKNHYFLQPFFSFEKEQHLYLELIGQPFQQRLKDIENLKDAQEIFMNRIHELASVLLYSSNKG